MWSFGGYPRIYVGLKETDLAPFMASSEEDFRTCVCPRPEKRLEQADTDEEQPMPAWRGYSKMHVFGTSPGTSLGSLGGTLPWTRSPCPSVYN